MNALLAAICADGDRVSTIRTRSSRGWAAWDLETALWALPGIGQTKATKLIARKRPRLYPIFGFGRQPGSGHRAGEGGRPPRRDLRPARLRRDRLDGRQEPPPVERRSRTPCDRR
ncbi:DUF6308 family protein [Rhodococcus jostii]|uniref:DUF6308 family protein n=1 Tax=Rhodococcus jostii TaxID=132919 RepID=UPI003634DCC8